MISPQTRSARWLLSLCGALLLLACASCGAIARDVTRSSTPAAVKSGVKAATASSTQQRVASAIEPQQVERLTKKVVAGATDGAAKALSEPQRRQRVAAGVDAVVRSAVDTAVDEALNDEHAGRVRLLAKQATLGFQDAVDQIEAKKQAGKIPADEGNMLNAAENVAQKGNTALYAVGAVAGVLALALLVVGLRVLSLRRRRQSQLAERDAALGHLARAVHDSAGSGSAQQLQAALRDASTRADEQNSPGAAYLRQLLAQRPEAGGEAGVSQH